jgi:hypothetical protein
LVGLLWDAFRTLSANTITFFSRTAPRIILMDAMR